MSNYRYIRDTIIRRTPLFTITAAVLACLLVFALQQFPRSYVTETKVLMTGSSTKGETQTARARAHKEAMDIIRHKMMTRSAMLQLAGALGTTSPTAQDLGKLRSAIELKTIAGRDAPTLLSIKTRGAHADDVAYLANEVAALALQTQSRQTTDAMNQRMAFLKREAADAAAILRQEGDALEAFRIENAAILPWQLKNYQDRIARIHDRLVAAAIRPQYERETQITVKGVISRLEQERDAVLALFSAEHPTAKRYDAQIAHAKSKLQGESDQSLLEVNTALLRVELSDLEALVGRIPEASVKLVELERNYDQARAAFDAANAEVAALSNAARADRSRTGLTLSILEPATPPLQPTGPPRQLLFLLALATALALAIIATILVERRDQRLRRPHDLHDALGLTPFAVIPHFAKAT